MLKTVTTLFISAILHAYAAPFNDGFAKKQGVAYINNASELMHDINFEKVQGMKGKYCLRLYNENQKNADFIMQPIQIGKKYEVSFRSKFDNIETLENNPTLEPTTRPSFARNLRYLPIFELRFLDKDKKLLSTPRATTVALPFGEWHKTRRTFIAPPNSAFMQCSFASGINNGKLYLDDIKFKELDAPSSGVHFKFDGNKYDYSFFGPRNDAGMIEKNGKKYFMTGYGNRTETFILTPERTYTCKIQGIQLQGYHSVSINYFDDNMQPVGKEKLKDPCNTLISITPPKQTKYANILIYNHLLQEITIK